MNAVRRGIRNTFRNTIRSVGIIFILAVAIALSISMLIARDGVNNKIASVRSSTGNTVVVSPAGFFGGQGGGTALTEADATTIAAIPHVTSVDSSLSARLDSTTTNLTAPTPSGNLGRQFGGGFGGFGGGGSFTPPVRVMGTNHPGTALVGGANNGGTETLTSGSAYPSNSNANVAIVGQTLASTNKLVVGSSFSAWATTIHVVGIYNAGSTFANAEVLMPLASVQRLSASAGEITNMTVHVDTISNVPAVQKEISTQLGSSADVTSQQQIIEAQLSPLNSVKTISTYTLLGTVIGAGIILLLSMLMIVRERRREIGVLKALGASNRSVITQFIAESTTFTVMGASVGLLLGVVIASPITSALVSANSNSSGAGGGGPGGFFRSGGGFGGGGGGGFRFGGFRSTLSTFNQVHVAAGWSTLAVALVIAILVAIIGSSVAVSTIVRIRPAEVLRSE